MSSVPSLECCQVNTAENSRYIASYATVDLSLRDSQMEQSLKALNSNAAPEKQRIYSLLALKDALLKESADGCILVIAGL